MTEINKKIIDFIDANHVISIASYHNGELWAFNAFYTFQKTTSKLIILTSKNSVHGTLLLQNSSITGTISDQTLEVSQLIGLQFSGKMYPAVENEIDIYLKKYQDKFPISKNMKETVWLVEFDKLKYTDNTLGFGAKIFWER
ncbi:PNPOx family protein [Rhizosphaericola mali]|uniref:Pyridoxamine 5'-phosphate oxidase putative domain-containing protein n=1 Tax=Rhizosphaericola mali TaxID=2545455 RepID=A0A5P2FZK9_9BACT|nr:hypothetical protein [Rhizosphaericola mali]QES88655.1 hypothetical protein E0W69_008310 [Rhizosphaericola mali]